MGNRGGRLHDSQQKLTTRRWVNRAWICCQLTFNNRHRTVWGDSYTELFFLDEVTALAAGHRPCFECRRKDAEQFALLFSGRKQRASAAAMDTKEMTNRPTAMSDRIIRSVYTLAGFARTVCQSTSTPRPGASGTVTSGP